MQTGKNKLINALKWTTLKGGYQAHFCARPMCDQTPPFKHSLPIASVCVHFFQRGQLWAGCTDSGQLFLWHTDHRCTSQRISLPGASGITCMIQVKNQVCLRIERQSKCAFLISAHPRCPPLRFGWAAMVMSHVNMRGR